MVWSGAGVRVGLERSRGAWWSSGVERGGAPASRRRSSASSLRERECERFRSRVGGPTGKWERVISVAHGLVVRHRILSGISVAHHLGGAPQKVRILWRTPGPMRHRMFAYVSQVRILAVYLFIFQKKILKLSTHFLPKFCDTCDSVYTTNE